MCRAGDKPLSRAERGSPSGELGRLTGVIARLETQSASFEGRWRSVLEFAKKSEAKATRHALQHVHSITQLSLVCFAGTLGQKMNASAQQNQKGDLIGLDLVISCLIDLVISGLIDLVISGLGWVSIRGEQVRKSSFFNRRIFIFSSKNH